MAAALYFNIESTNVIDKTDRIRQKNDRSRIITGIFLKNQQNIHFQTEGYPV